MKQYEITFIAKEDLKEKAIKEMIESLGGKVVSTSLLGEKQFVFPIKKETKGIYSTAVFEIEPEKLSELNKKMGLSEEILRHLIIIAKAAKTEMPILKPKKVKEEIAAPKEISAPKEITAPEEEKKLEPPKKIAKPAKKVEKPKAKSLDETRDKPAKKVPTKVEEIEKETISEDDRLKELDKKLDELLKE